MLVMKVIFPVFPGSRRREQSSGEITISRRSLLCQRNLGNVTSLALLRILDCHLFCWRWPGRGNLKKSNFDVQSVSLKLELTAVPNESLMKIPRHVTKLIIACGIAVLLVSHVGFAAEQTLSTEGRVEWIISDDKGSELLLEVRQMPLQRVLSTITAKTGVPIHYSVVPEGLVTATCAGTTLKQVMECLLARKADLIVRYHKPSSQTQAKDSDKNQPVEMWVLGSQFSDTANCSGSTLSQQPINNSPVKSPESQADAAVVEQDQTDDLLKSARSKDAATRADAIGALMSGGRVDDAKVKATLEEALNDPNANVRAQAVSSLAHREGSAATAALQEALHDADAGVRLMAVDGTGNNVALLQQAVNDDDETVRNLAISKLEELQKKVK